MFFITFEGGEGSGKSTQSKLLEQSFLEANLKILCTREPGGTIMAEKIRELILKKVEEPIHAMTELLMINAARYEHINKKINPALKDGSYVICDRFVDSTMAYQGYGQKLGKKMVAMLHNLLMPDTAPNLTFILDIDPESGLERSADTKDTNKYESQNLDFHYAVRNAFLDIANKAPTRCCLINAYESKQRIHEIIIETVNLRFDLKLKPII
jgi:dTMP kinase